MKNNEQNDSHQEALSFNPWWEPSLISLSDFPSPLSVGNDLISSEGKMSVLCAGRSSYTLFTLNGLLA